MQRKIQAAAFVAIATFGLAATIAPASAWDCHGSYQSYSYPPQYDQGYSQGYYPRYAPPRYVQPRYVQPRYRDYRNYSYNYQQPQYGDQQDQYDSSPDYSCGGQPCPQYPQQYGYRQGQGQDDDNSYDENGGS